MQPIKINKKGQIVDTAVNVFIGLGIAVFVVFALILGISSLRPSTFFKAGSIEQAAVNDSVNNFTQGTAAFFAQIPAAMRILGIVLLLGFIGLIIAIVLRFRSGGGGGSL